MKIKDHPAIKWDQWIRPLARVNLPSDDLDDAILKGVRYIYRTAPHLEITLEHGGKIGTISAPISDPNFAQHICGDLKNNCIGKTVQEIGDRTAP